MTCLKETCRNIQRSRVSVQLRYTGPFSKIAMDQTTEQTVTKDTETAGGTCGFILRPGTVSYYYLNAEYRAAALRKMPELILVQTRKA